FLAEVDCFPALPNQQPFLGFPLTEDCRKTGGVVLRLCRGVSGDGERGEHAASCFHFSESASAIFRALRFTSTSAIPATITPHPIRNVCSARAIAAACARSSSGGASWYGSDCPTRSLTAYAESNAPATSIRNASARIVLNALGADI